MADVLRLAVAIQGVNNFSSAFSQASSQIGGIKGKIIGLGAGLAAAGPAIAFFAATAAANFAKASVSIAASFEKEMLQVQAVTNATGEQYEQLTAFAKNLGETTEFTAQQSAEAMAIFGRAGFDVNEIYEATPVALDLATAGMTDMATSAAILSNVLRGFQFETTEAGRVADVLTFTANNSFTSIETLTESFKMATPMAAAAGIEFEELSAAIGIMGNMGIQGTMSGTGLRQAIAKLLDPSEDAIKTMSRLGVELVTLTDAGYEAQSGLDAALPTYEALQAQQDGLKITSRDLGIELSGMSIEVAKNNLEIQDHEAAIEIITQDYVGWGDEISTLKGELQGLEDAMSSFSLEAKKNNLEVMEIRQQADRENRELTQEEVARIDELGEANDELAISRERLSIEQIELQQKIAEEEEGRNNAILSATQTEINAIATLKTENDSLSQQRDLLNLQTQETSLASQLLGIELGVQKEKVDALTASLEGQVTGTQSLTTILTELQNAGATTSDMMEIFSIRGGSAMLALQAAGADALGAFTMDLENAQGTLDQTAETMRSGMSQEIKLMESAWQGLQIELGSAFFPVLKDLLAGFKDFLPAIENIVSILPELLSQLAPVIGTLLKGISTIAESTGLFDLLTSVISTLTPIFEAIGPILEFVMEIFTAIAPVIDALGPLFENLTPIIDAVIGVLRTLLPIFDAVVPVIQSVITALQPLFDALLSLAPVFETIGTLVSEVVTVVFEAITPVIDALGVAFQSLEPLIDAVIGVFDALTPLLDELIPLLGDMLTPIMDVIVQLFSALGPIIEFIAGAIVALTPIIEILVDIIIDLLPLIEWMNIPMKLFSFQLELLLPLLELLNPLLELLAFQAGILALALEPAAFVAEALNAVMVELKDTFSDSASPMEVVSTIVGGISDLFWLIVDAIGGLITSVGDLLAPFLSIESVVSAIWDFIVDILDGIDEAMDGLEDIGGGAGGFVSNIGTGGNIEAVGDWLTEWSTGTGLVGVPATGPYKLHEGEIVLNPEESDALRNASLPDSRFPNNPGVDNQGTSTTISIGKIEIHANSEKEGAAAVRGVMKELENLNIRGDVEVL